jgi:hypothetical protein
MLAHFMRGFATLIEDKTLRLAEYKPRIESERREVLKFHGTVIVSAWITRSTSKLRISLWKFAGRSIDPVVGGRTRFPSLRDPAALLSKLPPVVPKLRLERQLVPRIVCLLVDPVAPND